MKVVKSGFYLASSTAVRILLGVIGIKVIAITIGSKGLGLLGQFMSLMTLITISSGGGITNGLISKISQNLNDSVRKSEILSAGFMIGSLFSLLIAVVLFFGSGNISGLLFSTDRYGYILKVLSIFQIINVFSVLFSGYLNGMQRSKYFAFLTIISSCIGLAGLVVLVYLFKLPGAMFGLIWLAMSPGFIFLLAYFFKFRYEIKISRFSEVDIDTVKSLLKYSAMLIFSACLLPIVQVFIRKLIYNHSGWEQVGLWQASVKLSESGLIFLNVIMANYYLPELGKKNLEELNDLIKKTFLILIPLLSCYIIIIWVFKNFLISTFYSNKFIEASSLLVWQAAGDIFKVLSLVFGFLIVLKEKLVIYIVFEIFLFSLLAFLSYIFVPKYGALGATYAYTISYVITFFLGLIALLFLLRNKKYL